MMSKQTYQEVFDIIEEDIKRLRRKYGIETLGEVKNIHKYFYKRKLRHPEKYERLRFDTNGSIPYSEDLEEILGDFRVCGILKFKYDVISEQ